MLAGIVGLSACGGETVTSSSGEEGSGGATPRSCDELSADYAQQIERARLCTPELSSEQCTTKVSSGIECGCATFVNSRNVETIEALRAAAIAWNAQGCGEEALCGSCPTDPPSAVCATTPPNSSAAGLCTDSR